MTTPTPKLDRALIEQLMFGTGRVRRFTQDSPVLPDVWLEFAKGPMERLTGEPEEPGPFPPVKLLLTPYRENHAGDIRRELRERLAAERDDARGIPRIIYNQSTVAATLCFEDLVRAVIPMTAFWERLVKQFQITNVDTDSGQENLAMAIKDPEHPPLLPTVGKEGKMKRPPPALLWMIRVVGALALVHRGESLPPGFFSPEGVAGASTEDWKVLVKAVADLIRGVTPGSKKARIYSISLNREASPTVSRSTLAIKADAARRLFEISCGELAWAVIDSGIDASHVAFRQRKKKEELYSRNAFENDEGELENCTRIVETYDFTQIELLLDPDTPELPKHLLKRLKPGTKQAKELQKQLKTVKQSLASGRSIDWQSIAPLLRIPQDEGEDKYVPPTHDHGTHVAGILAGNWLSAESDDELEEDLVGVCPDLRLYDLRVLDGSGRGDEFAVMAALQFVRYLNSTNDYMAVHGVNLSLSIPHEVSNYACGRTPVCEECERVIGSGVVVVAAAGNQGYGKPADGAASGVYNTISITDPGNADLVITVGATHRYRPHTYGVSYFSSRGPTGDGRIKPDLVAPGEKITAPLPEGMFGLKDGTSMAAPHVSGAAALLMARYNELVGRPARIKQILCDTATDLGRERYFQGAGMLDTLRALQSV